MNVGDMVTGQTPQGQFQARIQAIDDEHVTLDLNHPLAGRTLEFAVEIVGID
jgi:FKBP-type peptidyl-prolyl cis-trans isomerase 2